MNLASVIAALTFFLMPSGTTLYDSNLDKIATLPAGYFVLQTDAPAPEGYISVAYDDLRGFVARNSVRAVDFTPVTKYELTARFKCDNDGQPVNLRRYPFRSAEVIKTLKPNDGGRVYGTATGDALIKNGDTLWYYVNVDGVRGYCYYAHVSADDFPPNIIEIEPPEDPVAPTTADPKTEDRSTAPPTAVIVLIVALCVPVPFIMFFMFRKKKES